MNRFWKESLKQTASGLNHFTNGGLQEGKEERNRTIRIGLTDVQELYLHIPKHNLDRIVVNGFITGQLGTGGHIEVSATMRPYHS